MASTDDLPKDLERMENESDDEYKTRLLDVAVRDPGGPTDLQCVMGAFREIEIAVEQQVRCDLAWRQYYLLANNPSQQFEAKENSDLKRIKFIRKLLRKLCDSTWLIQQENLMLRTDFELHKVGVVQPDNSGEAHQRARKKALKDALDLLKNHSL